MIYLKVQTLNSSQLMDKILYALKHKQPFSVVSVGATESFVLAQYKVLSEEEFMNHDEAFVANKGVTKGHEHRGIRFPNIEARDAAVKALRKVDVVGYNLLWWDMDSGELTEKVFDAYDLWPKYVFEAHIRRVIMFSQEEKFHRMLDGKKIVIVCGYADEVKEALNKNLKDKLGFDVVGAIKINEYEDIERVKEELKNYEFDICLIAAGINAIILAAHITEVYQKVVFDIGRGMESLITGELSKDYSMFKSLGIDKLMNM